MSNQSIAVNGNEVGTISWADVHKIEAEKGFRSGAMYSVDSDRAIVRVARSVASIAAALDGRSVLVVRSRDNEDFIDLITPRLTGAVALQNARDRGVAIGVYDMPDGKSELTPGEEDEMLCDPTNLWCESTAKDGESGDFGDELPDWASGAVLDVLMLFEVMPSRDHVETMRELMSVVRQCTSKSSIRRSAGVGLAYLLLDGVLGDDERVVLLASLAMGEEEAVVHLDSMVTAWRSANSHGASR